MQLFVNFFAENPLLLLFTVIGLGYLIGNIKIFGFSLGVAAVLFVGIAFGALDKRIGIPEPMYITGLVLFVYAIGLQSGPTFFASFQKRGFKTNLVATSILMFSALVAVVLWRVFGISAPNIAGLFCGALTNTPALAATVETVQSLSSKLPPHLIDEYINSPVVSYGLAYPFGVLGVILWFYIFTKLFRINFEKEEADRQKEAGKSHIISQTFNVTNPAVNGKTIEETMRLLVQSGFALSRIKKGDEVSVVAPYMKLDIGDQIVAVGTQESLERARLLFGERASEHLPTEMDNIDYRRIIVSNSHLVGKRIHELQLEKEFGATITRVRRGDIDFVADPDTVLEIGDRVRVVTHSENLNRITKYFGDSMKSLSETDFLSISLGVVLGVLVGMIPLPLPNGMTFKLGFAGGPLIVALLLGRIERTGKIIWALPFNANLVIRQIGLVLFLAGIGTKAGFGFGATVKAGGWELIAAGAIITTGMATLTILLGYKYLKLPMSAIMGMVSGMQTQPACLAYATQQAQNDVPNIWYATVYPASMISKIVLAQLLVSLLITLA
jgi:putative transport protein